DRRRLGVREAPARTHGPQSGLTQWRAREHAASVRAMTDPTAAHAGNAFRTADLQQLAERGIPVAQADRQLALLPRPAGHVQLDRPCTPGDGIEQLSERRVDGLLEAHAAAAGVGRVSTFVPASGAATRMFGALSAARHLPGELRPE